MTMRTLFDGELFVHYGQFYVLSDEADEIPDLTESFAGQEAGLCGAATPGALWLTTGLHTGDVGLTVELHDEQPPLDPEWEEAVEVPFRPQTADACLLQWAGEAVWPLDLPKTDHRVRYCATGMQQGRDLDTRCDGEPQADRYLLQFWPAPPQPARLLKQTSRAAAYWHEWARLQPPPPTPEERAEAERRARAEEERLAERERLEAKRRFWGGRLPSAQLDALNGHVRGLLAFDAGLLHALDAAGADARRAAARLAARRACEVAGLADLDWVAPALAALEAGRPLPPPFDDEQRVWQLLETDARVPSRVVLAGPPVRRPEADRAAEADETARIVGPAGHLLPQPRPADGGLRLIGIVAPARDARPSPPTVELRTAPIGPAEPFELSQPHAALPAVFAAAGSDPLQAAVEAVVAAAHAYGGEHRELLDEIGRLLG